MKFVIRAGGVGTRLWPYSRQSRPKQFHAMAGQNTMIQEAVDRLQPISGNDDIFVSTGSEMVDMVREQLPDLSYNQLIVEPALRNTGPAVGLECALLEGRFPGCVVASLGSDHYIGKPEEFCRLLNVAESAVDQHPDCLVTIGVVPTRPETGYGYIRKGELLCKIDGQSVFCVPEFKEKPDEVIARDYVSTGEYLWNSNMFVWKAATVLNLFRQFEPEIYTVLEEIREAAVNGNCDDVVASRYPGLPSVAIDNAIIERAPQVATIEGDFNWGDIGTWAALTDVLPADDKDNLLSGSIVAIDARNVTAFGMKEKLIALIGVDDLVVVDTADALLVCRKDQAQRVKEVLELIHNTKDYSRFT